MEKAKVNGAMGLRERLGYAFRSLGARDYRLFFTGQVLSLIGGWIRNIALSWLVYRLTASAFLLGLVDFTGQIPALLLTPFAGVFADRWNRRRTLLVLQSASMALSAVIAVLVLTERIEVWHIICLTLASGVIMAFETPFRHSFIPALVGRKDLLSNGIALNSTAINMARFVGPMVGGYLIDWVGEGYCFAINSLTFVAIIIALLKIRTGREGGVHATGSVLSNLVEGIRYSFSFTPIRVLIIVVAGTSLLGVPFRAFLPVYAKDILGGGSHYQGILLGSMGAGALLGALVLAMQSHVIRFPRNIFYLLMLFASALVGFAFSTNIYLSVALIFLVGLGMTAMFASTNTFLQTIVPDEMRGRVVSLYSISFMGFTPLGSLGLGILAHDASVPIAVCVSGTGCLLVGMVYRHFIGRVTRMARGLTRDSE